MPVIQSKHEVRGAKVKVTSQAHPSGTLRNIGPITGKWLAAVGIHTLDDLKQVGVVNAYNLVKANGYNANLNLRWVLQGALTEMRWTKIPATIRQQLKNRLEGKT